MTKQQYPVRSEAGFTLIEVMIATGVFAISIVMLLGGMITISTHNTMADQRARATNFARSSFEDLRGRPLDEILNYDVPVDNPDTNTVLIPGIGDATARLFAIIPQPQNGGFAAFELGVDDPATVDPATLPNPVEIRAVVAPVHRQTYGDYGQTGQTQMSFSASTRVAW